EPGLVERGFLGHEALLLERRLELDPPGDVEARAEIADKLPIGIAIRRSPIADPSILAVVATQAIRELEGFAFRKGAQELAERAFKIVGMNSEGPAFARRLAGFRTAELDPRLVDVIAVAVGVGAPDHHGRLFRDRSELCFRRRQPRFQALAERHVLD